MIGMNAAGKGLLALLIALAGLTPATGQGLQQGWRYAPPPGITSTSSSSSLPSATSSARTTLTVAPPAAASAR